MRGGQLNKARRGDLIGLEAEQNTSLKPAGFVDAVLVKDESCGQGAQLDEAVPVSRVAREARDLQAHDNAGLAEPHLAHELLEAVARCRTRSRLAEIAIDDMNALDRPARGDGPIAQRILALRTLTVLGDLAERRLTDVEVSIAPEMIGGDLGSGMDGLHCDGDARTLARRRVMSFGAGDGSCDTASAGR